MGLTPKVRYSSEWHSPNRSNDLGLPGCLPVIQPAAAAREHGPAYRAEMALRDPLAQQYECNDPHVLTSTGRNLVESFATRKYFRNDGLGAVESRGDADAFLVRVALGSESREIVRQAGKSHEVVYRRNDISIRAVKEPHAAYLLTPFDSMFFYFPRATFDAVTEDIGSQGFSHLDCPAPTSDPIVGFLARALMPLLTEPDSMNSFFVDQLVGAVSIHVAQRYGGLQPRRAFSGGLAQWQKKRALEYMSGRGLQSVSIAEIAAECRLSRSYFIKAFKQTLGETPHRWLLNYRVEKAKEMLLRWNISIAEIATTCGFADQSHLTRVFNSTIGLSPGVWRRKHRLAA